jgi:uncharacterized membrane protein
MRLLPALSAVLLLGACSDSAIDPDRSPSSSLRLAPRTPTRLVSTTGVELIDLGPGMAHGVNNNNQVVGVYGGNFSIPFVYSVGDPGPTILEYAGATYAEAKAINNNGVIAGALQYGGGSRAVTWNDAGSAPVQLTAPSTTVAPYEYAAGINDHGVVVGGVFGGPIAAVVWRPGADIALLEPPGQQAISINNNDVILGNRSIESFTNIHVVIWGGPSPIDERMTSVGGGKAINDAGEYVFNTFGGGVKASLAGARTNVVSPDPLHPKTTANAINSRGDVVGGIGGFEGGVTSATIWFHGGNALDLGKLTAVMATPPIAAPPDGHSIAADVNDRGIVVGTSYGNDGLAHAVVWILPRDPDSDGDGIRDAADNCPSIANPSQSDLDDDGAGCRRRVRRAHDRQPARGAHGSGAGAGGRRHPERRQRQRAACEAPGGEGQYRPRQRQRGSGTAARGSQPAGCVRERREAHRGSGRVACRASERRAGAALGLQERNCPVGNTSGGAFASAILCVGSRGRGIRTPKSLRSPVFKFPAGSSGVD